MNHAPIEDRYRQAMQGLARSIDESLNGQRGSGNRAVGFVLLVFPFDRNGRCNYISNTDRSDVVRLLRDQADRMEALVKGSAS